MFSLCPKELSEAELKWDGLIRLVGEISRHPGCGMAIAHFLQLGFKQEWAESRKDVTNIHIFQERNTKSQTEETRQMHAEQLSLLTETGAAKDKSETLFWDKRMTP